MPLKDDAWSPASDQALILLKIDHVDLAEAIFVVNDRVNVTSNAQEYIAFPFEIRLPDSLEDAPPRATLLIDNVSREIGQAIRDISTAAIVTISVVLRADPDTIEMDFPVMRLTNIRYDALQVSGDLEFEDLTREPFPARIFSPAEFPGLIQ